jgi:hypothetical protein
MKKIKYIAYIICLIAVFGCKKEITPASFVGKWKAESGATIDIKKDSTFAVTRINLQGEGIPKDYCFDFEGNWKMTGAQANDTLQFESKSTFEEHGITNDALKNQKLGFSMHIVDTDPIELHFTGNSKGADNYIFLKQK